MTSTAHQSSYECPICCSSFKTKSTLTEHIKSVHDRKKCHNCNASILSPLDSECFICSASFSTNKCVVPSCKTTGLQSNFVHFPKNCVDRNAWKKILGVKNVLKNSQVCDKHFKPVDFIKISSFFEKNHKSTQFIPLPSKNLPKTISEDFIHDSDDGIYQKMSNIEEKANQFDNEKQKSKSEAEQKQRVSNEFMKNSASIPKSNLNFKTNVPQITNVTIYYNESEEIVIEEE